MIMINKYTYKFSVKDILDKYYEMFRDKNGERETSLSFIKITQSVIYWE